MDAKQFLTFLALFSTAEILKIVSSICTERLSGGWSSLLQHRQTCIGIVASSLLTSERISCEFNMTDTWKTFYLRDPVMTSNLPSTASRSWESDGSDSGFTSFIVV